MMSWYFGIWYALISGLMKKKELSEPQMQKIFVGKPFEREDYLSYVERFQIADPKKGRGRGRRSGGGSGSK